jgi:hypothetical protein
MTLFNGSGRSLAVGLAALMGASVVALAPQAVAQSNSPGDTPAAGKYDPPRTKAGKPDFHGVWSTASVTRLERPAGLPLVLSQAQAMEMEGGNLFNQRMATQSNFVDPNEGAPEKGKPLPPVGNYDVAYTDPGAHVANINGEYRSSFIVYPENGRIPELTEEGKKLRASMPRRVGNGFDNPEERGLSERCIIIGNAGPPLGQYLYNNNFQIVQTDTHLMLNSEMIHDVRIAEIGGKHRNDGLSQWHGDSIAWWEGDTLVVETRAISKAQRAYGGTFLSDTGKMTEKFTRIGENQILYAFEVDDPRVYTTKWRGEMPLNRLAQPVYEYACHEGNYGIINILSGGRENDRKGIAQTGGESRSE